MAVSEFSLIERFFKRTCLNTTVDLGIGDDCALLSVPEGYELAVTTDTMVENVHFFAGTDPEELGYKLLAVNLSDLASMGAKPIAVTMALTLPEVDEIWLTGFSKGFFKLASKYAVDLIGGDTTCGNLTLTLHAMGLVPAGKALKRSTARAGDLIYLTGHPGDAGLGLKSEQGYKQCMDTLMMQKKLHQPEPRVEIGLGIRSIASACIDVSDGLASDLGHILKASNKGAYIQWEKLPLSSAVNSYIDDTGDWMLPLTAGDDYELCFTVPSENVDFLESFLQGVNFACSRIGIIEASPGLRLGKNKKTETLKVKGYEHFAIS